jgi:hypothetical protein
MLSLGVAVRNSLSMLDDAKAMRHKGQILSFKNQVELASRFNHKNLCLLKDITK